MVRRVHIGCVFKGSGNDAIPPSNSAMTHKTASSGVHDLRKERMDSPYEQRHSQGGGVSAIEERLLGIRTHVAQGSHKRAIQVLLSKHKKKNRKKNRNLSRSYSTLLSIPSFQLEPDYGSEQSQSIAQASVLILAHVPTTLCHSHILVIPSLLV